MNERQKIVNNIQSIYDENENIIKIDNISIEFSTNKYASKKNAVWRIILNDKNISKHNSFKFTYLCATCNAKHIIGTTHMLRKINKCSLRCDSCKNVENDKCKNQSIFMKKYMNGEITKKEPIPKITDIFEKKNNSIKSFDDMDDDFKKNYFSFHLTNEDYERIKKNIISFQNGKYTDLENIEYWAIYNSTNQMNFTHIMFDKKENILFKPHQPILKCDVCENTWRAKSIERFKNTLKITCKDCTCVNKTFKIRKYKNINNENIIYQSKLELKFINWCNNSGLLIYNGPKIKYFHNNKELTYKVDFMYKNILIEIKDDHIWHKNDIKSGKWNAKETSVNELINKGIYKEFIMITPRNWMEKTTYLKAI
jgi:hypothetical protein